MTNITPSIVFSLRSAFAILAIAMLSLGLSPEAAAQPSYDVLHWFYEDAGQPNELLEMPDGTVYGTTSQGGYGRGTVFKLTRDQLGNVTVETLHRFTATGLDGSHPYAGLTLGADGNFYGVTHTGGAHGVGTIFRITAAGVLTTLYAFDWSSGAHPWGKLLLASDGNLYGTTVNGGTGYGTVFRLAPDGTYTVLKSFAANDGAHPYAGLTQGTDGDLYGTTSYGGSSFWYGTVFKISTSGAFTTLHSFNYSNGGRPLGKLQQSGNEFYGTTESGGSFGYGTVFSITSGGSHAVRHSFDYYGDGGYLWAGVIKGSDGNFYGTTLHGGSMGSGTVYRLSSSGSFAVLHSFSGSGGYYPRAALIQGLNGNLLGTTEHGGSNRGTVYEITSSGALTTLHTFLNSNGGTHSYGAVIRATDGNLYGTTYVGGASGYGTVFRLSPSGTYTVLHSFSSSLDGAYPLGGVLQASDGHLYGTTVNGGMHSYGTLFRLTLGGTLTTLHSFDYSTGGHPAHMELVQGSDGALFGTTYYGGPGGYGTVFRITTSGSHSILASFDYSNTGGYPFSGVVFGSDGALYGTTHQGGYYGYGTVFKATTGGTQTSLHDFDYHTTGGHPRGRLAVLPDGTLFGLTVSGGANGYGTLFKLSTSGTFTPNIHEFDYYGQVGAHPHSGLTTGSDGNVYGATLYSGSGHGSIFQVTPAGSLTPIYSRSYEDGIYQYAPLTEAENGVFYGTTLHGGIGDRGTVFRLSLNTDSDDDGVLNDQDNCPAVANPDQNDNDADLAGDACDADDDNDTILDAGDNCPLVANSDQADSDGDGIGNTCDPDDDNDTRLDGIDNCPLVANTSQNDFDGDGSGDACDFRNAAVINGLTITANSIIENGSVTLSGSITDPDPNQTHAVAIVWGDGANSVLQLAANVFTFSTSHIYLDDAPTGTSADNNPVTVVVSDSGGDNGLAPAGTTVTVTNQAPVINSVSAPIVPVKLGTSVAVTTAFADVGTLDSHTCTITWADGGTATTTAGASGSCTANRLYAATGVYPVTIVVKDDDTGEMSTTFEYIVIYDPTGGFVTGGGWINSPLGAYVAEPTLAGKANFGFVSKYVKGATVPTGETEFQFRAGDFNFHSSSYQWLVVSGARAQYKGTGRVNGQGDYTFLLSATDGQVTGGGGVDKIRLKVWDTASGTIVYDNNIGAPDALNDANPQAISGGSIVVHSK